MSILQFAKRIETYTTQLSSLLTEWRIRTTTLHEIEEYIVKIHQENEFTKDDITLASLLTSLSASLALQFTDLRSEVVKAASNTTSVLAIKASNHMIKCAATMIPTLVNTASGANSVMRGHAHTTLIAIFTYVQHPSILADIIADPPDSKNKFRRALCIEMCVEALQHWPIRYFKKDSNLLEQMIVSALRAGDSSTRLFAVRALHIYSSHFPFQGQEIVSSLDTRTQKLFQDFRAKEQNNNSDKDNESKVPEPAPESTPTVVPIRRSRSSSLTSARHFGSRPGTPLTPISPFPDNDHSKPSSVASTASIPFASKLPISYSSRATPVHSSTIPTSRTHSRIPSATTLSPSTILSVPSSATCITISATDHEEFIKKSETTLATLKDLVQSEENTKNGILTDTFVDNALIILSDWMELGTSTLQQLLQVKRYNIQQQRARMEHDAFLDSMDNFK